MIIRANGINEIMFQTCKRLIEDPDFISNPRGMQIAEVIDAKIILTDPQRRIITIPERKLSTKYLAGELAFYFAGSNLLQFISHYSSFWKNCSDDGETVTSAYGMRLFYPVPQLYEKGIAQFEYAYQQLVKDKDTRKAVMMIYAPSDAKLETKDNPCTIYLQAFIRNKELHLFTYMRSNDVWFGLSYDIPFFTIVQELLFVKLKEHYPNLQLGFYVHSVGSLHLYQKDLDNATKLISHGFVPNDERQLPDITPKFFKELDHFLRNEEKIRGQRKQLKRFELTDPFLNKLIEWLSQGRDE